MTLLAIATLVCFGAGDVSVVLPNTASSTGLEIFVSEIAEVKGDDPALVARVKAASLGYAPAPGYHRTLRADLIEASLQSALPGVDIDVSGAPRCRISPATQVIEGASITDIAATALRTTLMGVDASAKPEGKVPDLEIPSGSVEPRIVAALREKEIYPGLRAVPVEIWFGDRLYRTLHVQFRVSVWQRRAILRQAVNVRQALHAGLFETKRVGVDSARGEQALSMSELAGAIALKPMAAGSIVFERDVFREVVVRRGDQVTVRVKKGSVNVTDVGVVQADARMGERVSVVLRSTGRELIAAVKGPRSVEVTIQ